MVAAPTPSADPLALAVGHLNAGAPDAACACLAPLLQTNPDHPVALTLMGLALLAGDHFAEAERHFRLALAISPDRPEIALHLARTVRLALRPGEAADICWAALRRAPDDEGLLEELAISHSEAGAFDAAVEVRARLALRPGSLAALRDLGVSLQQAGRSAEAEQIFSQALAARGREDDPAVPDLHYELAALLKGRRAFDAALSHYALAARDDASARVDKGRAAALQHLGRFKEAAAALRSAVASDPLDMEAHLQLNELLYRQGQDDDFLTSYDEAAAMRPEATSPLVAKGRHLLKLGDTERAYGYFDRALARSTTDLGALIGQARALEALGRTEDARLGYERALAAAPNEPVALIDSSGFLLRTGQVDRAQTLTEQALALQPHSQEALALLTLCYRAARDERELALADCDALVGVFDLDAPPGFADMATFNRQLEAYLAGLHRDVREHFTQTLRGGTRLYDAVFDNGHDLAGRLRPLIDQAIARYVRALGVAAPAPLLDRRTNGFRYVSSWTSRLVDQGFHVNHIHPEGWISAVYYVAVPDVCESEAAQEGWLKFGEPAAEFGGGFAPRRLVKPRPGRLVLFPSYFWHGTTSFAAAQARMTIAFDVAPSPIHRGLVPVAPERR